MKKTSILQVGRPRKDANITNTLNENIILNKDDVVIKNNNIPYKNNFLINIFIKL